jgi:hypothetical protein
MREIHIQLFNRGHVGLVSLSEPASEVYVNISVPTVLAFSEANFLLRSNPAILMGVTKDWQRAVRRLSNSAHLAVVFNFAHRGILS